MGGFSHRYMVRNIINFYEKTDEEHRYDWYQEARLMCEHESSKSGYDVINIIGVLAALSPLKSWDENVRLMRLFLNGKFGGHFGMQINKAKKILIDINKPDEISKVLSGRKTSSFFWNIYDVDKTDVVTVDRHAIKIASNTTLDTVSNKRYSLIEKAYIEAGRLLNVKPQIVQSATWLKYRELK